MTDEIGGGGFSADDDEFAKKIKKKKEAVQETPGIAMTSLMDIMVILLVFLLVSITSDPLNVQQNDDLVLAKSTAETKPRDSIPITVNKRTVIADKVPVAEVSCKIGAQPCTDDDFASKSRCNDKNMDCSPEETRRLSLMYFYIDKRHKEDGSDRSYLIEPLTKELERLVKQLKEENEQLGRQFDGVTTVICDKDIPFRLLTEIVYSAGRAGLYDIRFAIIKSGTR